MPRTQTIGEQLVRSDALHDYFRQGPATALMVSIVSTMVSLRLWAIAPHDEVGLWVGSLIGLQIVRLLLSLGFRRRERSPEETRNWGIAATVLSVCLGLVLSLGAIWFSRDSSVPDQIFILFVLGGFSAGSLTINAFHPPAMYAFITLSIGPYAVYQFNQATPVALYTASGLIIYIVYMSIAGSQQARTIQTSIRLRHENWELVSQLQRQAIALNEANTEKTRFFAAASHDLRQPLHALGLYASLLRQQVLPVLSQGLAARISSCVDSLDELFATILDVSHAESTDHQPVVTSVKAQSVIDRILVQNSPAAEAKGLALRNVRSSLALRCNRAVLERILSNLVSNAIRNTHTGGIVIGMRRHGKHAQIRVIDTGVGIPTDKLNRIFDEFYQVERTSNGRSQGLGLGLSIVKRLCDTMAYRLTVISKPGIGSCFSIDIPIATLQDRMDDGQRQAATAPVPEIGGSVLLVDDDPAIRDAMELVFDDWNVEATFFSTAEEGLDAIAETPGRWQHFILDYRLGDGMNGLQLAVALLERAVRPESIMLLTGELEGPHLAEARKLGLTVLQKPIKALRLRAFLSAHPEA